MGLGGIKNLFLLAARESDFLLRLMSPLRADHSANVQDSSAWDRAYASGRWSFLNTVAEEGHYLIIASYAHRLKPDSSVLDVGCGEGVLQAAFRRFGYARYLGLDISEKAIATASRNADERTSFQAVHGDSFTTDERFDVIVFNETLYYFADPRRTVQSYAALLKPDGVFIISMAFAGFRDALMKLNIWRNLARDLAVIHETTIYTPDSATWVIRAMARPQTVTRLRAAAVVSG
jgi:2-polyprenyl-3-methyl-5-hydroxy-6-metoxy-1,4-benzoquinol methylase